MESLQCVSRVALRLWSFHHKMSPFGFLDAFIVTDPCTVRELGSLDNARVRVSHGEAGDFRQTNKAMYQNLDK